MNESRDEFWFGRFFGKKKQEAARLPFGKDFDPVLGWNNQLRIFDVQVSRVRGSFTALAEAHPDLVTDEMRSRVESVLTTAENIKNQSQAVPKTEDFLVKSDELKQHAAELKLYEIDLEIRKILRTFEKQDDDHL